MLVVLLRRMNGENMVTSYCKQDIHIVKIEVPKQEHDEYKCENESRKLSPAINVLPIEWKEYGEEIDEDMPAMILHSAD